MEIDTHATTLAEILCARDRRVERQREIIQKYSVPLISYMVNAPGAFKSTPLMIRIFDQGLALLEQMLLEKKLRLVNREVYYYPTGAEAFLAVDCDEMLLKKKTLDIEEEHPLGRLFDFDIIGRKFELISRQALGYPQRKCLICEENAHICGRSKRHSLLELTEKIQYMAENYFEMKVMPKEY